MEALYVVVPIFGLIIALSIAAIRHERQRLKGIKDQYRAPSTPEQRAREAYDDISTEW